MAVDSRVKQAQKNAKRAERLVQSNPVLSQVFESSKATGPLAEKMLRAAEQAAERIRKEAMSS